MFGSSLQQSASSFLSLGACPRIRMGRVPSAAGADARRRDAGDVGTSSRSANAADAHAPPEPEGIWVRVAAQPHGGCAAISALLVVNDVPASPPPRALSSPRKPHARGTS